MYAYIMYFTSYFVIAIAFYLRKKALSQSALPTKITYDYWAKSVTNKIDVDSLYSFIIEKCYDGYRVYINRVPNLFISRDKTNYNPHLYKEKSNSHKRMIKLIETYIYSTDKYLIYLFNEIKKESDINV